MSDPEAVDHVAHGSTVIMTPDECLELLRDTPIGRVVFVIGNQPTALPVNYRWHDGAVVFRALEGTPLLGATRRGSVAFEVDRWDERTRTGASVLIKGTTAEVTDWADKEQLEQLNLVPWAGDEWRQSWIRIVPNEMTGRRIA